MENFHIKRFDITYYYGPTKEYIVNEEIISDIANSGMTLIPLHYDTVTNKKALPILNRHGINAVMSDPRIRSVYDYD